MDSSNVNQKLLLQHLSSGASLEQALGSLQDNRLLSMAANQAIAWPLNVPSNNSIGGLGHADSNLLASLLFNSYQSNADSLCRNQMTGSYGGSLLNQHSNTPLTIPATTLTALTARVPNFFQTSSKRALEVQETLARIAAVTSQSASSPSKADKDEEKESYKQSIKPSEARSSGDSSEGPSPVLVYMDCDKESLSEYQCLLRKQIELFEATEEDVQWNAQGRNKAIVLGQVGIRCRYCARLPTWSRARGAVYYSATLDGLYQAAQNMAKNHLCKHCQLISDDTRKKLLGLRDCKKRAAGGKRYWAEGAQVLGVIQCAEALRFKDSQLGKEKEEIGNGTSEAQYR